jgi:histidine triad (HIT) family protein
MPEPDAQQCIFCKIISGEVNSLKVYEDDQCLAILDINPASKGHLLLLPKKHFQLLPQVPDELIAHMGQVVKWLSNAAVKLFAATGVSVFGATGSLAGQNAPHVILHLIPRYPADNVGLILKRQKVPAAQLIKLREGLLQKIKADMGYSPKEVEHPKAAQETTPETKPLEKAPEEAEGEGSDDEPNLDDITNMLGGGP